MALIQLSFYYCCCYCSSCYCYRYFRRMGSVKRSGSGSDRALLAESCRRKSRSGERRGRAKHGLRTSTGAQESGGFDFLAAESSACERTGDGVHDVRAYPPHQRHRVVARVGSRANAAGVSTETGAAAGVLEAPVRRFSHWVAAHGTAAAQRRERLLRRQQCRRQERSRPALPQPLRGGDWPTKQQAERQITMSSGEGRILIIEFHSGEARVLSAPGREGESEPGF